MPSYVDVGALLAQQDLEALDHLSFQYLDTASSVCLSESSSIVIEYMPRPSFDVSLEEYFESFKKEADPSATIFLEEHAARVQSLKADADGSSPSLFSLSLEEYFESLKQEADLGPPSLFSEVGKNYGDYFLLEEVSQKGAYWTKDLYFMPSDEDFLSRKIVSKEMQERKLERVEEVKGGGWLLIWTGKVCGEFLDSQKVAQSFRDQFGSLEGRALSAFVQQRVRNFVSSDFFYGVAGTKSYSNWSSHDSSSNRNFSLIADNRGMHYWFQGLLDRNWFSAILINGRKILFDSPSNLVVLHLKQYQALSLVMRQSVLIHEARHSDCNEKIDETDLNIVREARSYADWKKQWKDSKHATCGYFHSICPPSLGMQGLSGVAQCDAVLDGPNGLQALFLEAMILNPDLEESTRKNLCLERQKISMRIQVPKT
jgi:hypothetical protein